MRKLEHGRSTPPARTPARANRNHHGKLSRLRAVDRYPRRRPWHEVTASRPVSGLASGAQMVAPGGSAFPRFRAVARWNAVTRLPLRGQRRNGPMSSGRHRLPVSLLGRTPSKHLLRQANRVYGFGSEGVNETKRMPQTDGAQAVSSARCQARSVFSLVPIWPSWRAATRRPSLARGPLTGGHSSGVLPLRTHSATRRFSAR